MRIGSVSGSSAVQAADTSKEEAAIRKQIVMLRKELQSVDNEKLEKQEAAAKKKEIEQQIAQDTGRDHEEAASDTRQNLSL